jgi:hypothetical protein
MDSTFLLPDNIVEQTFFAFVIGSMCAGALVSLSYYLSAFIAYVYPLRCRKRLVFYSMDKQCMLRWAVWHWCSSRP